MSNPLRDALRRKLICLLIILVLSLAGNTSADLVAHWQFDETSGSVANDASGNGNNGTLKGDPQWVTGRIGGAILLDGDGDYVDATVLISTLRWTTQAIILSS